MVDALCPRLVDIFPGLVAEIVALLEADGDPLAETIEGLSFLGLCCCNRTCTSLLTASPGSSGSRIVQLQRDGEDVIWLSLDRALKAVTDIEVLDGRDLGPAAQRAGEVVVKKLGGATRTEPRPWSPCQNLNIRSAPSIRPPQ